MNRVLECSSRGDKRFSALYAKLKIKGVTHTIEEWYQLSKRFGDFVPKTWKDGKGKRPTHIEINKHKFELKYLTPWYKLLWVGYFNSNPDLLEYAKQFDEFRDSFARRGCNNQADVIAEIVKNGKDSILRDPMVAEIRNLFYGGN
jgi:hypothetical protein